MNTNLGHFHSYDNHTEQIPIAAAASRNLTRLDDFSESNTLRLWWRHVQQIPLLSAERERELGRLIAQGDHAAFLEMVEGNLRLVANIARRCRHFAGQTLTLEDLIQEGCMGLMRAARKFDYRRGYKFSTYASYWIRQSISRSIADQGRTIRLPVHMVESVSRAERARTILTQQMQRPPSTDELSAHLKISEPKLTDIMKCLSDSASLDTPLSEDSEDVSLVDMIKDEELTATEDQVFHLALHEHVRDAINTLPEREATVLKLHFGLNEENRIYTLDEVGKIMDLTRERIRQIEKNALKLLKKNPVLADAFMPAEPRKKRRKKAA